MLIIHLPPVHSDVYTHVLSPDGLGVGAPVQTTAQALPHAAGEVVAVVPWQVMSWLRIDLPKGSQSRLHAVVPSLLEERLLQDLGDVHWVLAADGLEAARQGGSTLVAVCSKTWLRQALAPLQAAGCRVQRIVPELTPRVHEAPSLLMTSDTQGPRAVLCTDHAVLPLPTHTSSWSAFAELRHPELQLRAEPAQVQQLSAVFGREPQLQTPAQRWLLASRSSWNLAQGEWQQTGGARLHRHLQQLWQGLAHEPAWGPARWGVFWLVLVHLIGLNAWAWHSQRQLHTQQAALTTTLQQTFPQVTVVVDAPLQMQRQVQALRQARGAASPTDMDVLLDAWAQHLGDQATPSRIDYRAGQLHLSGLSAQALARAAQAPWAGQGLVWQAQGAGGVLRGATP